MAKKLGCRRFVYAGSIMEYEALQGIPKNGVVPLAGNLYSIAKLSVDFMAKTLAGMVGINYVNTVISNIYGPGEYSKRFLLLFLKR